jgi:7-keto-8-aminopelargonate synthetase-like enzyme
MSSFNKLDALPGPFRAEMALDGRSFLYFGGTAYLGMPADAEFLQHYVRGLGLFGVNNGTSRNNNVQLGIYVEAEEYAARTYGAESALILSSGYLAAQLCVQHLSGRGKVVYAPGCHPALLLNDADLPFSGSFNSWKAAVVAEINESDIQAWVLVSNSMNNLIPEIYDFSFLKAIDPARQVLLLVDDSHGIGVINGGTGAFETLRAMFADLPHIEVVVVASMAKALGVDAGLVLGTRKTITGLKETPVFAGASPPAAAALYAFMQSKALYERAFRKLRELQDYTIDRLKDPGAFHFLPNFPVLQSRRADLAGLLLARDILISSFPYPDRNGPALNRIILCSWHTGAHIDRLLSVLNAL